MLKFGAVESMVNMWQAASTTGGACYIKTEGWMSCNISIGACYASKPWHEKERECFKWFLLLFWGWLDMWPGLAIPLCDLTSNFHDYVLGVEGPGWWVNNVIPFTVTVWGILGLRFECGAATLNLYQS